MKLYIDLFSVASQLASAYTKRRLPVANLSSENNLPTFDGMLQSLMTTGAFSQNIDKVFSELKLVADNLLFIYVYRSNDATIIV